MCSIAVNYNVVSVVSPINKNLKSKSSIDYDEQKSRSDKMEQIMWDDVKGNPTKTIGGLFGFVRNSIYIEFHIVTEIHLPENRLESWSENVGQTDRNVLYLSDKIYTMDWKTWLELGCAKKIQGTSRVVSAHESLTNFFKNMFRNIEVVKETGEIICL
jgi:hypothetical protein